MNETALATLLILASACLHAVWNAILKSGTDRTAMIGVLNIAGALFALPLLFFVPMPDGAGWQWIGASVAVHLMYQLSLARMMASADYSLVYPISRGLGPLVVTLIALAFLGEDLNAAEVAAILVLVGGATLAGFAGAVRFSAPPVSAVSWACLVGLLIGIYTLIDGSAVKRMSPLTFILWSNIMILPFMMLFLYRTNGGVFTSRMMAIWPRATVMTIVAYGGYTMALFAFRYGGLAEIAALRETSIFFAAFVGIFWLREKITGLRILGISLVAVGAVLLKIL